MVEEVFMSATHWLVLSCHVDYEQELLVLPTRLMFPIKLLDFQCTQQRNFYCLVAGLG